jgi:polysaccharide pyruvyl transferase WcaK-like protein
MAALRVLHVASHEINVGDGALNEAIRSGMKTLHGQDIDFDLRDVAVFREEISPDVLDTYDLVIVGGGGGISNGAFASRTGTPMPVSLDVYSRTRTPFVFVGLGHNLFNGQTLTYARQLIQLLEVVRRKGDIFSVRNDGSRSRLLEEIGAPADFIREIPDPGFFIAAPERWPSEAGTRHFALIQIAGDAIKDRLPTGWAGALLNRLRRKGSSSPLTDTITQVAHHLWRKHGLDILLTPHIHHDVPLCSDVLRNLYAAAGRNSVHRPFRMGGTPHPMHANEFFGRYRSARLVIGMRGHAVICGIGMRCPTIALSSHPKVGDFLESCDLADWSVPLSSDSALALTERCDALLANDEGYFTARDRATGSFQERFNQLLADALARGTESRQLRLRLQSPVRAVEA